jgi:3-oxoacyl-[acyl-carrier protein] reductase
MVQRALAELGERLPASGAAVSVWDATSVHIAGVKTEIFVVTRPDQITAALLLMPADSRIDILVNSAGYVGKIQVFEEHAPAEWQRIVAVNLISVMQVTQAVLPYMPRSGAGRIVEMASLAGQSMRTTTWPNHAVNTDGHRRRCAPWWSPVTLVR